MKMIEKLHAWWLGFKSGFGDETGGITYYDNPWHPVSVAYDRGRNLGEKLSRRWS